MIRFEHPLNERIRTLMRLEDLHQRANHFAVSDNPLAHHTTLLVLFEILEIAARADIKSDLLQELERQRQVLSALHDNPAINTKTLGDVLEEIERAANALHAQTGKFGQHIRDNEWLMTLKQRASIPGGMCEFDLPSYHYWLHLDAHRRQQDLMGWLEPFNPTQHAAAIVLKILRESGRPSPQQALNGTFQLMLNTSRIAQLLRIQLDDHLHCVPEISANKYALNIRFVTAANEGRPRVCEQNIDFELSFCTL